MAKTTVTLTINNSALKKLFGESIQINVDENGVALDRYWRNRIRDSKIDNCVTITETKKSRKTETTK